MNFFRFPHTPHLDWLGEGTPRDNKVLSPSEIESLLSQSLIVEEKVDGANIGISLSVFGELQVQNRGQYLMEPFDGQFEKLNTWLPPRYDHIFDALGADLILFGEWCAARHSIHYDRLPDWFLVFDIYDLQEKRFFSTQRRDDFARQLGLHIMPQLDKGRFTLSLLKEMLDAYPSQYYNGPMEGIVVRSEEGDWLNTRAKLVSAQFTQNINGHWRKRTIRWNRLDWRPSQKGR
jgi:ATP-dependent RNA circularization protein (DNA/RNA ligase family)